MIMINFLFAELKIYWVTARFIINTVRRVTARAGNREGG